MSHTYTEDQQAQRTLTLPLPAGEEANEQPAIGLFAELSLLPPRLLSGQMQLKSAEKI